MRLLPMRKISRHSKRLALFLTFCAGYVDAYTFIVRGNTLVAGQTGWSFYQSESFREIWLMLK